MDSLRGALAKGMATAKTLKSAAQEKVAQAMATHYTVEGKTYEDVKVLGEGAYSFVHAVREVLPPSPPDVPPPPPPPLLAMKRFTVGDAAGLATARLEIDVMRRLAGHPNILRLHASELRPLRGGRHECLIILDLASGGSAVDTLMAACTRTPRQLSTPELAAMFGDAVAGVAAMHALRPAPAAHRDLKAENLLFIPDDPAPPPAVGGTDFFGAAPSSPTAPAPAAAGERAGRYVLCDFGSTSFVARVPSSQRAMARIEEEVTKMTTPNYRAPEMADLYSRKRIDERADLWALGVLLYYFATLTLPFDGNPLAVSRGMYTMPPEGSRPHPPYVYDTIRSLLRVNAAERPSAASLCPLWEAATGRRVPPPPPVPPAEQPLDEGDAECAPPPAMASSPPAPAAASKATPMQGRSGALFGMLEWSDGGGGGAAPAAPAAAPTSPPAPARPAAAAPVVDFFSDPCAPSALPTSPVKPVPPPAPVSSGGGVDFFSSGGDFFASAPPAAAKPPPSVPAPAPAPAPAPFFAPAPPPPLPAPLPVAPQSPPRPAATKAPDMDDLFGPPPAAASGAPAPAPAPPKKDLASEMAAQLAQFSLT